MKVEFAGKNLSVTDALREKVEKKLQKLEKFTGKMVSARITLEKEKHKNIAELVIHCSHDRIYKAKGESEDMYLAINDAANAIEQQAKKTKGKILANRSKKSKIELRITQPENEEIKEETTRYEKRDEYFAERPLTVDDALLLLEEKGFPLLLFKEMETQKYMVISKVGEKYILVEGEKI